ncbi:MAG: ERCC4 domain-containing protein [Candidatus Methanomethylophilaceae archaeon]|nr:ERCC4 domain-containing protein [Candidatus Methanomethylophilaceae archaeon]
MIRHWTEAELKAELKKLTIICDTREQDRHVEEYFKSKNIPVIVRKLDTGDYSAQIGYNSLERDVVIERKHNLDELCGNMTADRDRFEREFLRAKAYGLHIFLIVENATWTDVMLGNYRSKLSPKSLSASIFSWLARFDVTLLFCQPHETPKLIYGILYYYCREELLYGER